MKHASPLFLAILLLTACYCPCPPARPTPPAVCEPAPEPPAPNCFLAPCGQDQAAWVAWEEACCEANGEATITCPGTDTPRRVCHR